jgi:hypothetical protein
MAPAVDAVEMGIAARQARFAAAATQPTFPAVRAAAPADADPATDPHDALSGLSRSLRGSYSRLLEQDVRLHAERRMAAMSLAAQLYRLDERRWPRRLDELVPRYLSAVPRDPFRADGGPLSYLVATVPGGNDAGAERPVVYHVAADGKDQTPDASVLPPTPMYSWHALGRVSGRRESPDQWRDLSRFAPPGPPPPPVGAVDTDGDGIPDLPTDPPLDEDAPAGDDVTPGSR